MTAHLNYVATQEKLADLARSAERERLAQSVHPIGSGRSRGAWRGRLLVALGVVGTAIARRASSVRSHAH